MKPRATNLALSLLLAVAAPAAAAAQSTTFWATAPGTGPVSFVNHASAHDHTGGPNATFARGEWTGAARKGSFSGFNASLPAVGISKVEVVLHLYRTAPVTNTRLSLTLMVNGQRVGPVAISQPALNRYIGPASAGMVTANFSLLRDFTAADLAGLISVDIMCKRKGPDDGAQVFVDAVGLRLTHPGFDPRNASLVPTFGLRLAGQAVSIAAAPLLLTDVTSPVTVPAGACPDPLCYLQVLDGSGASHPLTVALMPDGATVRVGFDDGLWAAPVDPVLSTVVAPAGTVPSDGVSQALVRITVLDAGGWPLGGKLALRLDPSLLGGAEIDGDVTDLGNGTYQVSLVSLVPTTAVVSVTVEGVTLLASPAVFFN